MEEQNSTAPGAGRLELLQRPRRNRQQRMGSPSWFANIGSTSPI